MGENSKIEWTDHTFNPWIGCQKVSCGCDNCYAEAMMDHRYHKVEWGPHGERKRTSKDYWRQPLRWNDQARKEGRRRRVFCASLADVFDNQVEVNWRRDLFMLIWQTKWLDWLLLTKRPENIKKMLPNEREASPWATYVNVPWLNVWIGVSIESEDYWYRYDLLSEIPCAVRFISYEPALGPLRIAQHATTARPQPDWIICGGESGPKARQANEQWFRTARDDCARLEIPFFFKQMVRKAEIPADLRVRQFPGVYLDA